MIARLLGEKGVREYIEAARILKARYPEAEWLLVGDADVNPDSLSPSEIEQLKQDGAVRYLGYCPDIRPVMAMASVCVLPSYREGIPRTIQEAMAMGRAVIVTNTPGCRETVRLLPGEVLDKNSTEAITGENGFLVPVKNVEKLCEAMEHCLADSSLRAAMGAASLRYAEERFDVNRVNEVLLMEMGL
jgi:glycosyltransferase involved in cell wall biosynthesis